MDRRCQEGDSIAWEAPGPGTFCIAATPTIARLFPTSEKVLPCPGCGLGKPVSDIPRLHFCNLNRSLNCTLIQSVWGQRSLSLLRDTLLHVFTTET